MNEPIVYTELLRLPPEHPTMEYQLRVNSVETPVGERLELELNGGGIGDHDVTARLLTTEEESKVRKELNSRVDFHDIRTHRSAWRKAIEGEIAFQSDCPAHRTYWEHELAAFDRTFDLLEAELFKEIQK